MRPAGLALSVKPNVTFGIIVVAYSLAVAGVLANTVLYDKVPLAELALQIATYCFCAVVFVLMPIVVFAPNLFETKIEGLSRYGTLATEYTQSFHQKWILGRRTAAEPLLGSGDIQSLADLGNSFSFVDKMKLLPIGSRQPIHLALAALLPMSPLLLTVMPVNDLLKLLVKAVL